ncbi:MAG TPA: transketolase [Candidatus Nanoarchaeia archaeon]|nr:transketolase [Candidatus Nanoarchaeia archaeon]
MVTIKPIKKVTDLKQLKLLANQIRQDLIEALVSAGSGHTAGPLGMADVFTALYFNVIKHNPKYPFWEERDRVVLSNGHICPVIYSTMANVGYFPRTELKTLRHFGTRLQGHPHRSSLPGLETTSGPLGSGLSQAAGMAYAFQMDKKKNKVYCLMSDGEQEAGQTWEAAMFAGKNKLRNLVGIIDRNNIQIDGHTEDIMPLEPLADKYRAFNWHVIEIDANNIQAVIDACNEAATIYEKPTLIMAHNIPGKGVSFMENDFLWHGKPPTAEQAKVALAELKVWRENIVKDRD